ncbi:MAG TPA: nitroreductase, partial [Firmicutes bacterium]|nr:nitroreductase [Bacillota bacterium]
MIKTLILKNRSYRRFHEAQPLTRATLVELVDLARCTPSAANRQPLKYFLSSTPERNGRIFPCLQWAGYLKDWQGPAAGERPTGYIVILGDTTISKNFDCDLG